MVNLTFNQLLTGLRTRREQELKEQELREQELKEQEPGSRAGGLNNSKVVGCSLNIPQPSSQHEQAKVVFTLKDFIERKKAEVEKQEEEAVKNVEDDSDTEEVVEMEKGVSDEEGDSTDDDVSMDDDGNSELELIKPDNSNKDEEAEKKGKKELVLNNIINELGPKQDDSDEVDKDAREHNLRQDLKEELTKFERSDEEDDDLGDIFLKKSKQNFNLESTDEEGEDADVIPQRKVKKNLMLDSTDEEDEDEDDILQRKVKKNLKLESTDEEEDYENDVPPMKVQEKMKLGKYSGLSISGTSFIKTNQKLKAIIEPEKSLFKKKIDPLGEKHSSSMSITSLPQVNKRKATENLENLVKRHKIKKKSTKSHAKTTPVPDDTSRKASHDDVTLEEVAEDDDEAGSFEDINENLTEEFDLCLHGDLVNDYLCYECTYNRWRVEWNSVHTAARSKDKPVFTELSHKLNIGRFRNISIKRAADTSPRKEGEDQSNDVGKKAEEEKTTGPFHAAPPRAKPTFNLPSGLPLSSRSGRLPSGISFSTFRPAEEKKDCAPPPPPVSEKDSPPPPVSEKDSAPPPVSEKDSAPPPVSEKDSAPPPVSESTLAPGAAPAP